MFNNNTNYGALNSNNNNNTTIEPHRPPTSQLFSPSDEEQVTLLHKPNTPPSYTTRLTHHFNQNVSQDWADSLLLSCYIITGLLDSSSVYTFGSFVSMQTGNTIYIGTGIVAPSSDDRWIRALISVSFFCLGSFTFARFHRWAGMKKRWVIVFSLVVQTVCVGVSAAMVSLAPKTLTPQGDLDRWVVVPLALVGFQAAGQAYLSRVLKYNALTSVVLTSVYHDLFADAELFVALKSNVERNQRIGAVVLLLCGAMLGGVFAHSSVGLAGALWTATGLKVLVIIAYCFWKQEKA